MFLSQSGHQHQTTRSTLSCNLFRKGWWRDRLLLLLTKDGLHSIRKRSFKGLKCRRKLVSRLFDNTVLLNSFFADRRSCLAGFAEFFLHAHCRKQSQEVKHLQSCLHESISESDELS